MGKRVYVIALLATLLFCPFAAAKPSKAAAVAPVCQLFGEGYDFSRMQRLNDPPREALDNPNDYVFYPLPGIAEIQRQMSDWATLENSLPDDLREVVAPRLRGVDMLLSLPRQLYLGKEVTLQTRKKDIVKAYFYEIDPKTIHLMIQLDSELNFTAQNLPAFDLPKTNFLKYSLAPFNQIIFGEQEVNKDYRDRRGVPTSQIFEINQFNQKFLDRSFFLIASDLDISKGFSPNQTHYGFARVLTSLGEHEPFEFEEKYKFKLLRQNRPMVEIGRYDLRNLSRSSREKFLKHLCAYIKKIMGTDEVDLVMYTNDAGKKAFERAYGFRGLLTPDQISTNATDFVLTLSLQELASQFP